VPCTAWFLSPIFVIPVLECPNSQHLLLHVTISLCCHACALALKLQMHRTSTHQDRHRATTPFLHTQVQMLNKRSGRAHCHHIAHSGEPTVLPLVSSIRNSAMPVFTYPPCRVHDVIDCELRVIAPPAAVHHHTP
jgi:hypothetical protein